MPSNSIGPRSGPSNLDLESPDQGEQSLDGAGFLGPSTLVARLEVRVEF
jgi:hypothetical protein